MRRMSQKWAGVQEEELTGQTRCGQSIAANSKARLSGVSRELGVCGTTPDQASCCVCQDARGIRISKRPCRSHRAFLISANIAVPLNERFLGARSKRGFRVPGVLPAILMPS